LFCIHHAGGGAAGFRNWPRLVDQWVQIGAITLPGRENLLHERPITDFATAVNRICKEIETLIDRPYALFGHSLGATLAFETACRLGRESLRAPACLIVSGSRAPNLDRGPDQESKTYGRERLPSNLPDDEFLQLLRNMGGTPVEILNNADMMRIFMPIIRADFRLGESYKWDGLSRCHCPILALGGDIDRDSKPEQLAQWGALTNRGVTVRVFHGGHFFIMKREAEACKVIMEFLERHIPLFQ
jgi:surfactin synthase thioesterase subunit